MNEVINKDDLLEALNELEQLVKAKLSKPAEGLEAKLTELENKVQTLNEKNKKVYDILGKVITELEGLLTKEETRCKQ
jgi:hypothetical protein